ncbi:hypothetical protein Tco_0289084, partial [Tanacetum coccineum]
TVMSDSKDSTIAYTAVSSPFADLSDIGSPEVDGPPVMPEDPYAYVDDDEDPEEDPADYPADKGDNGDDEDESSDDDEDDDVDIDEDEQEERLYSCCFTSY